MAKPDAGVDQLFVIAEQLASDFELFPENEDLALSRAVSGLLPRSRTEAGYRELQAMPIDDYIRLTVAPAEDPGRPGAKTIINHLPGQLLRLEETGPLLMAEVLLDFGGGYHRRVGIIAQERSVANGVWLPQHHLQAADYLRQFANHSVPVVTLIDTPGADAGAEANQNNQAHSISRLISEFAQIDVPTLGIIVGNGYSGGAIPLATTNLLLAVRDGVFNTILPRGLASIARKYDLSWQECARYVGVSAYELHQHGYLDGIVDFVPGEAENFGNFHSAIVTGIRAIESAAIRFAASNPYIFEHYQRSIERFLNPSRNLQSLQARSQLSLPQNPTSLANVFGLTYRYMRFLTLRRRIHHTTIERYGHLSNVEIPRGDLSRRTEKEHQETFRKWLGDPFEIKYDDLLRRTWLKYSDKKKDLGRHKRGAIGQFFFGDPATEWGKAMRHLCLEFGFHLYNLWKDSAPNNFVSLIHYLLDETNQPPETMAAPTVQHILLQPEIRRHFIMEAQSFLLFDLVYDNIVDNLTAIATEAKDTNVIGKESVERLLERALGPAVKDLAQRFPAGSSVSCGTEAELRQQFNAWLLFFARQPKRERLLRAAEQWKKMAYPRVSEPLFAIVTFLFERLIPNYIQALQNPKFRYEGAVNLRNIGVKDFWNRLAIAYQDLLIQDLLQGLKKARNVTARKLVERFFPNFRELNANLMSADPARFPGFRLSIEKALADGITPCGLITGIGEFRYQDLQRHVGVLISNQDFQAGAFDMASAEKFCKLMLECALRRLPVIGFVASSGMQTKEGAGALFSMAIVNDRITRFIRDNDLPVIMFGFGDCTGGAQASLVTHPLVQTYYFSGTNMPFAGQVVVPAYLPSQATLSNYLSQVPGAMQGLVRHPFATTLDDDLRRIDPELPIPAETVEEVIVRVLRGGYDSREAGQAAEPRDELGPLRPIKRVLIHARGCAAVKLVSKAHELQKQVVLVQSDADMDSVVAQQLHKQDRLVCIGGNTPDESYLNAKSVIHVAEREKADSLHPGIGFLSENPDFADLCRRHAINFIGPSVHSMELMGNKSNATNTARQLQIPVVPGSQGVLTDSRSAAKLAADIGYPVILKAVYGGGGKGIRVITDPQTFHEQFLKIAAEAKSAFGNSDVYLEKFVQTMRHVEVQVLRDRQGHTKVLGLRDCSVQRQNQKLIEESGSTLLPAPLEAAVCTHAAAVADKVGYTGAGTVEFIFDLKDQAIYFMEMNTRLQVEHPVTEAVSGVDIVAEQFRIAEGASIADLPIQRQGYAIEVRINAEKATLGPDGQISFVPDPGKVTQYEFPSAPDIVLISTVDKGRVVPPYYDSMIVQVIAHGRERHDTIAKLLAYLEGVKLRGVCTNIPLLKVILADEVFRGGNYDTGYLPALLKRIDAAALVRDIEKLAGVTRQGISQEAVRIENSNELKVLAPSAGVFYLTSSPNEPEFVRVGKLVTAGDTLCLLEAMKLFRPLTLNMFNTGESVLYPADKVYRLVRVNPANGQAVNKGDLLFVIEPVAE